MIVDQIRIDAFIIDKLMDSPLGEKLAFKYVPIAVEQGLFVLFRQVFQPADIPRVGLQQKLVVLHFGGDKKPRAAACFVDDVGRAQIDKPLFYPCVPDAARVG